jgi:hypothetical protein
MHSPLDPAAHLRTVFAQACSAHEIRGRFEENPPRFHFEAQQNAEPALLARLFDEELGKAGITASDVLAPRADLAAAELERVASGLRQAVARLGVLLIELNSYLSGGLTWVFPDTPARLRERGLAAYRYPARAPVDIAPEGDHMRLTFHASDLGKVTSSGFYVPTLVRGDFAVTLRYRLGEWRPGAHTVCLALFAQDELSQLRYYAQRRAAGTHPHEVMANFNNQVLTTPLPAHGTEGVFKLERRGDLVISSHRAGDAWTVLGEHRGDPARDVVFGSKIWSSGEAGMLEARLFDLRIEGELPAQQIPPVPIRPDPRGA